MPSINKIPQRFSLSVGENNAQLIQYAASLFFPYIQRHYEGIQFCKTFDIHGDELLGK